MIPQEYVLNTCKLGQGDECCAYLMAGVGGITCAKDTPIEMVILGRLEAGTMNAKGDNCPGWGIVMMMQMAEEGESNGQS